MCERTAAPECLPLAAILAGGASRRFGAPKPFADLEGRPLLARVRDAVAQVVPEPVLITNDDEPFRVFGLRSRSDALQGTGPLGGVLTALLWAEEEGRRGALCVACDTPFLPPALLQRLVDEFAVSDADLVAPQSDGPLQIEPLCAVYHVRCIATVRHALGEGVRALGDVVRRLRAQRLPLDEVRRYGEPEVVFLNVNTRDQYARAMSIARQLRTTTG